MEILNLTPHPVTIIRDGNKTEFPACAPAELPRATEGKGVFCGSLLPPGVLWTCAAIATERALETTGLVESRGYSGVENLPELVWDDGRNTPRSCYIVSIVTVIGAVAAGRPVLDLLVPMGQVRDATGRIIGATSLAPAADLLGPMAVRLDREMDA